jgi:hypothetical protein
MSDVACEADWLAATLPSQLLRFMKKQASRRQYRLFGVACCRTMWAALDPIERDVVDAVERYAEGEAMQAELDRLAPKLPGTDKPHDHVTVVEGAVAWLINTGEPDHVAAIQVGAFTASYFGHMQAKRPFGSWGPPSDYSRPLALARDIFGNPFRPLPIDPTWRTGTIIAIARHIYAERAFDCMPILADALEDAGCSDAHLLDHCRQSTTHVRGCWAIDLLLKLP